MQAGSALSIMSIYRTVSQNSGLHLFPVTFQYLLWCFSPGHFSHCLFQIGASEEFLCDNPNTVISICAPVFPSVTKMLTVPLSQAS